MTLSDRPLAWLQRLALACAVMALAVTSLSASMRLTKAGIGCGDTVACGQPMQGDANAVVASAEVGAMRTARMAHRVIASTVLLTLLTMLAICWRARLRREGQAVLVLLGVTLFLAVLGRWSGGSRAPAVVMGNLLGGFALFALSLRLALVSRLATMPPRWRRWTVVSAVVLVTQLALGALASVANPALACGDGVDCSLPAALRGADWADLDPWRESAPVGVRAGGKSAVLAHSLHRHGSLLVLLALFPLAWAALRGGRARTGMALLLLLAAQVATGLATAALTPPLVLVLVHNALGAGLLAVLLLVPGAPVERGNTQIAA